ncbi:MAG: hypothetical protein ACJAR3_001722 [Roseivirga sp.]|jgi:hypothetical protein
MNTAKAAFFAWFGQGIKIKLKIPVIFFNHLSLILVDDEKLRTAKHIR